MSGAIRVARVSVSPGGGVLATSAGNANRSWTARRGLVVELADDRGSVGRGEASPLPGYSRDTFEDAAAALADFAAPGPLDSDGPLAPQLARWTDGMASAAARFAIEAAVLDLVGQRLGANVARLLARTRDANAGAARPVTTCDIVDLGDVAAARRTAGAAVKIKIGRAASDDATGWTREVDGVARVIEGVAAVGAGKTVRVDVNGRWSLDVAEARCRQLADLGVEFIEQPVAPADMAALLARLDDSVPIGIDESLHDADDADIDALLAAPACRVAVLKPMVLGGILRCLDLAARARARGAEPVVSHLFDGPVAMAAYCELALALDSRVAAGLSRHVGLAAWSRPTPGQLGATSIEPSGRPGLGLQITSIGVAHSQAPSPRAGGDERLSIVSAAARWPKRAGLVVGDESVWFAELADRALVFAAGLYDAAADELALVARPTLDTAIALYAALEFGIPTALLHARLTADERAALTARTPRAFVFDPATTAVPLPSRPVPLDRLAPPLDADIAFTVYTSGTSGHARGVLLSRRALLASTDASAANLGWRDDDRWLCCLPLAHVGGLSILVRCLDAGATAVLGPPRDLGSQIERHRITLLSVVPTLLERVCDDADAGADVSSLRAVLVGGAPCPPALLQRARAAGIPALLTYGMSETASQIATMAADRAHEPAVLEPWPPPLPLLPGVEVRADDRGRLLVRGPVLMSGYAAPDHRPPAIDSQGWFATGDLGHLGADGDGADGDRGHPRTTVTVLGRADDVIITGGENVVPRDVEDALAAHPAVAEACVVGVPDPRWGQRVVAVIALADGPPPVSDDDLSRWLGARIAAFKCPREYVRVDALRRTASGKVDRAAARERAVSAPTAP